jgi:GlcNAc-P-P-Und epimerase
MKIAITGGEGFIGHRLIPLLKQAGHDCVIIDKQNTNPVDVRDKEGLISALKGCEAIYHLAAEHNDNVTPISLYYDVNVTGMHNLLAAADAHGIRRIIFTSSFAIYGLEPGERLETDPAKPFNDYGRSKWQAEEILQAWAAKTPQAQISIVRPVVVFGEGNRGNVYNLMTQIARGTFVMVGNGKNRKSLAYVGNVASFLHYILPQADHVRIFNYADKPDWNMNSLMRFLYGVFGKKAPGFSIPYGLGLLGGQIFDLLACFSTRKFPISAVRVRKFCTDSRASNAMALATGFVPGYDMKTELEQMVRYEFFGHTKA